MKKTLTIITLLAAVISAAAQPVGRELWNDGWSFTKDGSTRTVNLPHDWGVEGEFNQEYPGETGKLPWWGKARYGKTLEVTQEDLQKDIRLEVDGAMSNASVFVNGVKAGGWAYGYSSLAVDLTGRLQEGKNRIEIVLDNKPESSRWYPGGGIYRNVWITKTEKTSVAHWGTFITTQLAPGKAIVYQKVTLKAPETCIARISTRILYKEGNTEYVVAETRSVIEAWDGRTEVQDFEIVNPRLWSPENPQMYLARTVVETEDTKDVYETPFGIRSAEFRPDGFYLNGVKTFLKGVCLHHDAGALGAAWNEDAWQRRLIMLKDMGCNAIRMSHNPPAPELLDMCDRMGFLVMDELTDTWTVPKKENGYATLFNEWVEKDLTAMIRRDRNHPSVILWSIGNECGEQGWPERWDIPRRLTDLCHREDPTRLTTAGNDNPGAAFSGYAETIDVYGFNYKPHLYEQFVEEHPGQPVLGSETSSCISTRGYYLFPVEDDKGKGWTMDPPFQVSSYDLYAPGWASKPDYEWEYEDKVPECAGEFVWTGYDYLGEPTPFNMAPSRSSYFGIIDLAGFPKDRFWLYQSRWCPDKPVAHILPHWTWPGREGIATPVHVYTSGDEAELFLNGKSLGRKKKDGYRIVWDKVFYTPGTLEVVCYKNGREWARDMVQTAGKAAKLYASVDYEGEDLSYVAVDVLDKAGVLCPGSSALIKFEVKGPAEIVATDAGDPTSHVPFYSPELPAFAGKASVIIRRTGKGPVTVLASSKGLKKAKISL
ncbi:MAG: DUF4982 domain-containing protein [Bacteroidales bacterium]|nr:DUF4982 domain-containing protein [Bacteroidales bacterium]